MFEIKNRDSKTIYTSAAATTLREALVEANLTGANLTETNLSRANLSRANLTGADLTAANLTAANLSRANLSRANIFRANLTGAHLLGANLTGADLLRANLTGADLTAANLTETNLFGIREDFHQILADATNEIPGLRLAVMEGRIDGSTYEGPCACLVGTMANLRSCKYKEIPNIQPNSERPAERFFTAIRKGDTPKTNPVSAIVLGWIDEFIASQSLVA